MLNEVVKLCYVMILHVMLFTTSTIVLPYEERLQFMKQR